MNLKILNLDSVSNLNNNHLSNSEGRGCGGKCRGGGGCELSKKSAI
jgi:hypothetical protein